MNYYNLLKEIDLLINRFRVKANTDGYTSVVQKIDTLGQTHWYTLVGQLKEIIATLVIYQALALDGNLQDFIDNLEIINWYNFLQKAIIIEKAIDLIETL